MQCISSVIYFHSFFCRRAGNVNYIKFKIEKTVEPVEIKERMAQRLIILRYKLLGVRVPSCGSESH